MRGLLRLADRPAMAAFAHVTLPAVAASLGGEESLITIAATTSHVALSVTGREAEGIVGGLVRLSVGSRTRRSLLVDLALALASGGP